MVNLEYREYLASLHTNQLSEEIRAQRWAYENLEVPNKEFIRVKLAAIESELTDRGLGTRMGI